MKRLCLDCDTAVIGRSDKKFCDDACRSNYYYKSEGSDLNYIRKVNAILKKNRKLLEQFNPDGKTRLKMKILQSNGFNFDYYTNTYTTGKGTQYFFCYEHGYLILPPEDVLLVKKKDKAIFIEKN